MLLLYVERVDGVGQRSGRAVSSALLSRRAYLESDVAVSEELIQKYSNVVLGHLNGTVKELRRLFLVDDLVDSLKVSPAQPRSGSLV